MKFLCPNCKAKYQISDEKIAGRTLKMDCRRCNHPIVIRGDKLAGGGAAASRRSSGRSSGAHAAPRRRGASHVGPAPARSSRSALGADFRKNAGASAAPAKPTALDQWHIAINDVPVGPMKREEVGKKIQSGAVSGDSLCWREGFDDWRPLADIPELSAMLRRAAPPKPPPKPAFPSPGRSLGGRAAKSRPARPPTGRTAESRPGSSRPGSSRPAPDASRPAARGNVVPIGGRLGAAAAPALDELPGDDFLDDDEPTRVGSTAELAAAEREAARTQDATAPTETEGASSPGLFEAPGSSPGSSPGAFEAPASAPGSSPGAFEAPGSSPGALEARASDEDAFDPFASSAGATPAPTAAESSPGAFAAPPESSAPPVAAPAEAEPAERRRGLPIGAWIAIAGAMSFGVALAVVVGTHFLTQPAQPVAATTQPTPTPPTEPESPQEADVDPDLADPDTEAEAAGDEAPEAGEATPAQGGEETDGPGETPRRAAGTGGGRGRSGSGSSGGGRTEEVDEETRARLARFADDNTAGAQLNNIPTRDPLGESGRGGGQSLGGEQIRSVVSREQRAVQQCWQTALRQVGAAPDHDTRIEVAVTIGASGTVTSARARGRGIGNLTECIERTVRRWRFPRSSGTTRTSIPFVFQGSG
ncbi:MAG TPA: GYF domain-containing protein [Sandaracinaceae bacterium LLY-WYZ-13_1]|nr:GYF domain-containing protein [Sandaracinaceae bacterium LLY-WYZ-13_1]